MNHREITLYGTVTTKNINPRSVAYSAEKYELGSLKIVPISLIDAVIVGSGDEFYLSGYRSNLPICRINGKDLRNPITTVDARDVFLNDVMVNVVPAKCMEKPHLQNFVYSLGDMITPEEWGDKEQFVKVSLLDISSDEEIIPIGEEAYIVSDINEVDSAKVTSYFYYATEKGMVFAGYVLKKKIKKILGKKHDSSFVEKKRIYKDPDEARSFSRWSNYEVSDFSQWFKMTGCDLIHRNHKDFSYDLFLCKDNGPTDLELDFCCANIEVARNLLHKISENGGIFACDFKELISNLEHHDILESEVGERAKETHPILSNVIEELRKGFDLL